MISNVVKQIVDYNESVKDKGKKYKNTLGLNRFQFCNFSKTNKEYLFLDVDDKYDSNYLNLSFNILDLDLSKYDYYSLFNLLFQSLKLI